MFQLSPFLCATFSWWKERKYHLSGNSFTVDKLRSSTSSRALTVTESLILFSKVSGEPIVLKVVKWVKNFHAVPNWQVWILNSLSKEIVVVPSQLLCCEHVLKSLKGESSAPLWWQHGLCSLFSGLRYVYFNDSFKLRSRAYLTSSVNSNKNVIVMEFLCNPYILLSLFDVFFLHSYLEGSHKCINDFPFSKGFTAVDLDSVPA